MAEGESNSVQKEISLGESGAMKQLEIDVLILSEYIETRGLGTLFFHVLTLSLNVGHFVLKLEKRDRFLREISPRASAKQRGNSSMCRRSFVVFRYFTYFGIHRGHVWMLG